MARPELNMLPLSRYYRKYQFRHNPSHGGSFALFKLFTLRSNWSLVDSSLVRLLLLLLLMLLLL